MLLFIASKLYFFFSSNSGSSREIRPTCALLTSACVHLVWRIHSATIEGAARFWTPTGVKRRCSCGCVRLWNLKSFSVSEGSTDKTGKRCSLFQFCFPVKIKRCSSLHLPPISMQLLWWWIAEVWTVIFHDTMLQIVPLKGSCAAHPRGKIAATEMRHATKQGFSSGIKYLLWIW